MSGGGGGKKLPNKGFKKKNQTPDLFRGGGGGNKLADNWY